MKDEQEIRQMLADIGGNHWTTGGAQGVVKIRRETKRSLLVDILELDDDQMICVECLRVQDDGETWNLPKLCPDCSEETQGRLSDYGQHPVADASDSR